jgi:SNF2 family DNA or RNA helicase
MGQTKKVHVYQILAVGTTDVIITSLAREKNDMLKALVSHSQEVMPSKLSCTHVYARP